MKEETNLAQENMEITESKVNEGVESAEKAKFSFDNIVLSVREINKANKSINLAVDKQTSIIEDVNSKINDLSNNVKKGSETIDEIFGIMENLENEASELNDKVKKFKT